MRIKKHLCEQVANTTPMYVAVYDYDGEQYLEEVYIVGWSNRSDWFTEIGGDKILTPAGNLKKSSNDFIQVGRGDSALVSADLKYVKEYAADAIEEDYDCTVCEIKKDNNGDWIIIKVGDEEHNLEESFEIHDCLNNQLFDSDNKLKSNIKDHLIKIADLFVDSIKEDNIPINVVDYILIGSSAAYNYTEYSDIDLHVLVDLNSIDGISPDLLKILYNYIKGDFNNKYNITIKGREVEVYLQDINEPNASAGIYSLLKDEWLKFPDKEEPRSIIIEDTPLFKIWLDRYKNLDQTNTQEINLFIQDLYRLRKYSLSSDGEFGTGNLIFKEFRNRGYLQNLKNRQHLEKSKELTLEELEVNPGIDPKVMKEKPDWFIDVSEVKTQLKNLGIPKNIAVVIESLSEGFVIKIYRIGELDHKAIELWESSIIKTPRLSDHQLEIVKKYIGK